MAVSEIIARGLCQNLQKNHHGGGLQKTHLPHAKEVEIQILEMIKDIEDIVEVVVEVGAPGEEEEVVVQEILQINETVDNVLMSLVAICVQSSTGILQRKRIKLIFKGKKRNRVRHTGKAPVIKGVLIWNAHQLGVALTQWRKKRKRVVHLSRSPESVSL